MIRFAMHHNGVALITNLFRAVPYLFHKGAGRIIQGGFDSFFFQNRLYFKCGTECRYNHDIIFMQLIPGNQLITFGIHDKL
ncbi:hypothetical protein D9M68_784470 [compost metagenome]